VTSDAVFVDTAGRYQSEGVDGEEWSAMLETIKKHRSNRPLDGFLMVVNAEKILNSDSREIEEMAKVLRARLDDAMARLKVRFPVYLIFTHADSIEGFRDSFSTSKNEGKTLVWGATIPLEKSESAAQMFDGEYEILHNSVMKRRLVRLSAPFPPVRQLRIFNFPLHFGSARRKLGAFVSTLFRPNPFSENPFLRGFYFTAAPTNAATDKRAICRKPSARHFSPKGFSATWFCATRTWSELSRNSVSARRFGVGFDRIRRGFGGVFAFDVRRFALQQQADASGRAGTGRKSFDDC
jgi:type VI secretion system protein ImpL